MMDEFTETISYQWEDDRNSYQLTKKVSSVNPIRFSFQIFELGDSSPWWRDENPDKYLFTILNQLIKLGAKQ